MRAKLATFWLPLPPSVNGAYAGKGRRYKSPKYKAWLRQCKMLLIGFKTKDAVKIRYTMFFPDRRPRDICNYEKLVSDLLVEKKVIPDDNHVQLPEVSLKFGGYDKTNPRVEVEIFQWI